MSTPIIENLNLFSDRCSFLLRQATEKAEDEDTNGLPSSSTRALSRFADSSSEDEGDPSVSSSSSSSGGEGTDSEGESVSSLSKSTGPHVKEATSTAHAADEERTKPKKKKKGKPEMNLRQKEIEIQRLFKSVSCTAFPLPDTDEFHNPSSLHIPYCLLSRDELRASRLDQARSLNKLSIELCQGKPVIVFCLSSGRFAGAVFIGSKCVVHRTSNRYTVRKGQGKAQSSQDSQRRAKSMGAQLRRQGEIELQNDVRNTLLDWKDHMKAAAVVLISCPKTMRKTFFEGTQEIWTKDDTRVRRIPLDVGRPTFENACLIHSVLMTVQIRETEQVAEEEEDPTQKEVKENEIVSVVSKSNVVENGETVLSFPELTELHIAAREGNLEALGTLLVDAIDTVNLAGGEDWMTSLHFAAQSTVNVDASIAAECVTLLLETGHADPGIVDARNRPPYFLASHEKVRDAFRMSRARLGETYCQWDGDAKVGPPLTDNDIEARKQKEAEKRRKKKARQKDKKAKEKAQAAEMELAKVKEDARRKQEEEAKRIRDGLQPKLTTAGGKACDFCQTICKGRKRSQMFKRLEYSYCSSECVQKHKRELMASAALSRFS